MYWCYECEQYVFETDDDGCCPNCHEELEEEEIELSMSDLEALHYEEEWREQRIYESL